MRWLKQQGAVIKKEYIIAKINDYKESNYIEKLNTMLLQLDEIIKSKEFKNEMQRFLPAEIIENTLQRGKFIDFLSKENKLMFLTIKEWLT